MAVVIGEEMGGYCSVEGINALQFPGGGLLGYAFEPFLQAAQESGIISQQGGLCGREEPGAGEPAPLALHIPGNLRAEAVAGGSEAVSAYGGIGVIVYS